MNRILLEFRGISHSYKNEENRQVQALEKLNITVRQGSFTCLIGPSGCGKSTLLNMAAGFIKPSTGAVLFEGTEIRTPGMDRAVVFQEESLFPWMTVRKNLLLPLKQKGIKGKDAEHEVERLLDLVGIKGFDNAYPRELSMGMRQKVSIARGLALSEKILLMDEPFSALDERSRIRLNRELKDIWMKGNITVFFITHNIDEAIRLGTRIILLTTRPGKVEKTWYVYGDQKRPESPEYWKLKGEISSSMDMCCPKCECQEGR